MADWTDCLNFGISIAKQASEVVLSAFQQHKEVKLKSSPADLVTETDQRVEKILISAIRNRYPQHRFHSVLPRSTVGTLSTGSTTFHCRNPQHRLHSVLPRSTVGTLSTGSTLFYHVLLLEPSAQAPLCSTMFYCWNPQHRFIGEESVAAGEHLELTDSPTWIIDPIDGTVNFVHRFPFVAISIAFTVNRQTQFGIVYSCVEDKLFYAQRGGGAFLNGEPLHASGQQDISRCVVVTEIGAERDDVALSTMTSNIRRLLQLPVHGVRALGTAAVDMCQVATGGADAYYHIGMHCWDIAASAIIVQEAGGVVMDTDGSEFDMMSRRVIAASSAAVADRIAQVIQAFPCCRDDEDNCGCGATGVN
ncbi:inositol monophosphatase 1-like isoform X2 [Amphiprion ocellaris]|uniref:inositol monophosphatase 1-like isoform X2 n=1 Tax=Amphiprion ocellaris TaxID=80972 RepID=UPI002410ED89|nr:inositol monophosphatase 1-like isoform X2 [Amphiprion ocellaris]XP_054870753.1 inositol monophosphatase 1-like isoform X2 [Amphiprion ocellaris]XP_054870754.1 inositol monophosphatase 1-like isoform X2 [Amphiprion ocellaris]XP_054870755.1 inositol monophosphatase 1-like isoform X2 [Amphiprion ocellaris]XP_054870756.1 inositol monophosphatase 1-like isoform X2 [Amphiprion ocellaris]XP_054870757.1 inositol monophosphatase 1-like isoform X2 [Amphiprion ocellaris]